MGQMVIFTLTKQFFALPIQEVQEILTHEGVTPVPYAPDFVKGIMDVRDKIVPIIDLKVKFKLQRYNDQEKNTIVLLNLEEEKIGILVDEVTEVVQIEDKNIQKPPKILAHKVLDGIVKFHDRLIIILNSKHLLDKEEFDLIKELVEDA